jgi:DNA-binding response OmpR family regulator
MLILTFEDSEEEILKHIISYVSTGTKSFQVVENAETSLSFVGLEIDVAKRLLYLLASNPGRVFSKEHIYDIVWKEPYSGDYNIVMSDIRNIRKKIEDNPSKSVYIQTVWKVGYRFNKDLRDKNLIV